MKPLVISSGEPAGIGPDLCLELANTNYPVVIIGDQNVLAERAKQLKKTIIWRAYNPQHGFTYQPGSICIHSITCPKPVQPGQLNPDNAAYVLKLLKYSTDQCLAGNFSGIVTTPIHKGILNQAGFAFSGHTEYFATRCHAQQVIMLLACKTFRVALVTTHLPLKDVPGAITAELLDQLLSQLYKSMQSDFGIQHPRIAVAGLNPHAGEGGYLGREELEIIIPTIKILQTQGLNIQGPFSADTMFNLDQQDQYDVFVAMYHDQGLPVLKYASFGYGVNISLGLPFVRTSVDHGTALTLAGSGKARHESLYLAIETALQIAKTRAHYHVNN